MRSLDRCEQCGLGSMKTVTTRSTGLSRVRYLRCDNCGETGKEILRIDHRGRQVFFLQVDTNPSISPSTNFPTLAKE